MLFRSGPAITTPESLPILQISSHNLTNELYQNLDNFCQIESNYDVYFYGKYCNYNKYEAGKSPQVLLVDQIFTEQNIDLKKANDLVLQYFNSVWPRTYPITLVDFSYMHGEEESSPSTPNKANLLWMFYAPSFQNIPIITHNIVDYLFSFIVSSSDQVLKAELKTEQLNYHSENLLYPLISINQAIDQINKGKAYLGYV